MDTEDIDGELYELLSLVNRSTIRETVLRYLDSTQADVPSQIANETELYRQNVSRVLRELEEHNLVECRNPDAHKFRYYSITALGRTVLKEMGERK